MNLDIFAGLLCGVCAACFFSLWSVTNPKRRTWRSMRLHIRGGFLVTGVMFFWRSVDFLEGAQATTHLGHINAVGMMPLVTMTYTFAALAWSWYSEQLPGPGWHRLEWVRGVFANEPETVLAPATRAEVIKHAEAEGFTVCDPRD